MFDLKRVTSASGLAKTAAKTIPGVSDILDSIGLGEFLGISTKDVWRLKMKDSPNTEFKGQFIAEDLTENVGSRVAENQALNQSETDKKYLSGDTETITFRTRIWATSSIKNVKESIEKLKSFARRRDDLKRAPIFTFTAGTEIQCLCFVRSVGGIRYANPRSDGTIRGAEFTVTLTKIEELQEPRQGLSIASLVKTGLGIVSAAAGIVSSLGKINIPGGSLHTKGKQVIVKQGQDFEHIAQREYGDALVGDILRRAHYNKPLSQIKQALEIGDVIDLVDENEIFGIAVTPQSVPLIDDTVRLTNIKNHFETRGESRTIYV